MAVLPPAETQEAIIQPSPPPTGAPMAAIGLLVLACLCFSGLDTTAKYLVQTISPVQVVWMRFVTHIVLAFFLFRIWRDWRVMKTNRLGLQVIRACSLFGTTIFNFMAVQYLQLAETVSIMFASPFVVTALAGPLLGEWAGIRRWAAIIVGFCGVLVVTQPWSGHMHWAAIFSVGSMICFALYALFTRMLAVTDNSVSMLMISGIVAGVALAPGGLSSWVDPPSLFHWGLLLSTGIYGCIGHWIFIVAHRLAPAPMLAPFNYVQIIWMVLFGYLVFGDVPGWSTLAGAGIVVASGLYILYREQFLKQR